MGADCRPICCSHMHACKATKKAMQQIPLYAYGGSYLKIIPTFNLAMLSFYTFVWHVKTAIDQAPELAIRFPTNPEEICKSVNGFAAKLT